MSDTDKFGGFMREFLACFRDEYSKLPSLIFPTISMGLRQISASTQVSSFPPLNAPYRHLQNMEQQNALREALYLRDLKEFSTMNIVVQEPSFWPNSIWEEPLCWAVGFFSFLLYRVVTSALKRNSAYHQSAILSTLYETATLPLRCVCSTASQ